MTNDPNHYKLLKDKERKEIDIRRPTDLEYIHQYKKYIFTKYINGIFRYFLDYSWATYTFN